MHPCDSDDEQIRKCCLTWTKEMGNNLAAMMKIMRFANGRGKPGTDLHSIVPKGTTKLMKYSFMEKATENLDQSSMIPVCFFEDV